jgi:hypothetical protein
MLNWYVGTKQCRLSLKGKRIPLLKKEKANILKPKFLIGLALHVPLLGAAIPAEAAKVDPKAARAECYRKANEAVQALGFSAKEADKNAAGTDAYRQCCYKAGIRP